MKTQKTYPNITKCQIYEKPKIHYIYQGKECTIDNTQIKPNSIMTSNEQETAFKELTEKMWSVLSSKSSDYANEDRLSNFKLAGTICGLSPEQNCLSLIATKVARLGVLLSSGKQPNNESIDDSVLDLCNYSVLLSMLLKDKL